ncbi:MAG: ketopantoate reductase family protein [bacterium]|nr:ketopantoate reductase family protein [bacterium]
MVTGKVLLCGLGAVGLTYANKFKNVCDLKILADSQRIAKYKSTPPILNDKIVSLNYITPNETWNPDLIIISTKASGLDSAIDYIKNYVNDETIIISLLNGITSENKIAEKYGWDKVIHSYFIGHSAVRYENKVTQDGVGKIVFGSPYKENQNKIQKLKDFFDDKNINYEASDDIIYSLWLKFTLNIFANQASAIMGLNFGEMKNEKFKTFAKKIIKEVSAIAEKEGISGYDKLEKDSMRALMSMVDDGKTSMYQDILAKRKTEADIFSGEIIRLGEKHNIQTPYNQVMYDMLSVLEEN